MKILAVVVAYHPDPELLRRNLDSFADGVDHVLLWRNSPLECDHPKVELAGDCTNQGVGAALNAALAHAVRNGFDWLLTMDQDSCWEDFEAFRAAVLQRSEPALYGPRINDEALSAPFQPSDFLITSGMLVPVAVLDRLQGWRKDFRVDALDVDLVMRARLAGIPTYKVDAGNLVQQFGKRRKTHGFYVYDYSPRRLYDIFRNHILVIRTYPSVSSDLRRMFVKRWVFSRIPRILLGEKGRREKLRAIFRGIRAGFRAHPRPVVGVVTWFGTPNYGTTLQAFALVEALRHLGVSPFLIRRFDDPVSFRAVKDNWNRRLGIRRFWKYAPDAWPEKTLKIKQFCREHLPVRSVTGPRSLRRLKRDVELFLCGSDQLWNTRDHLRPFEFLGFADGCRKAAFATSIGTEDVPPEHARRVRSYLEDFGPISLRELSGVQALSRLTGRDDLVQVADPTFLLTATEWKSLAEGVSVPDEPYLLCYLLRKGQEEMVQTIAAQAGLSRILAIPAGENPRPGVGECLGDTGPCEFLALLSGAALFVTDSFHGLALGANLSKDLLLLKRFSDSDPASQNGRLYDLAARLGLEDRFYAGTLPPRPAWEAVQSRISEMRSHAWNVLKKTVL